MDWRKGQRSSRHGDSKGLEVRGEWLPRSVMERGASWSQQLDGNFAKRTPVFLDVSGLHGHQTLFFTYDMLISVLVCCCMKYSNIPCDPLYAFGKSLK